MLQNKVLLYRITKCLEVIFRVLELKSYDLVVLFSKLVICIRKIFVPLATDTTTATV